MRIVTRYVFRQAAGALLLILLSLAGVVWIALALRQLNVVTSQGQDVLTLIKMTTLALPNLLAVIAPFALLIATLHTLNRLNSDSELIVLTAAGANLWVVARPLIVLSVMVAMAVAYVNHIAMPWSLQLLREYIVAVRTDLLTQVIQPGRFTSPERGLTFHIRERALNGELKGLIMHDTRNPQEAASFLAETGEIVKQPGAGSFLLMTEGHIVRRSDPQQAGQIIAFERYAVDLEQFEPKVSEKAELRPRERYFADLLNPGDTAKMPPAELGKFRAELHDRLSSPLYPIAFVLIALATVGRAQSTRQNRTQWMVLGFVGAAGCRLGGLAVTNLVTLNANAAPLLYAIPLAGGAFGVIVILLAGRSGGPRRASRASAPTPAVEASASAGASAVRAAVPAGRVAAAASGR